MTEFIKHVQCPAAEFGLPECEEQISFRYRYNPRALVETYDEDSEWQSDCDCLVVLQSIAEPERIGAYTARVNSLLDAAPEEYFYDGD
jgi:hypothetical protein